jgi:hypothetical protein
VKTWIAAVALFSIAGVVSASPDEIADAYAKLKEAVEKKDPDAVKTGAAETSKLARELVSAPKPSDASEVDNWTQRIGYGKEVDGYTEYALGFTATQGLDPAKTIELVDALIAQNPKSKYLDLCAATYLAVLGKHGGSAKQLEGMAKLVAGRPDNEVALAALAEGSMKTSPDRALGYANRLLAVMKSKPKPEGVSAADWERAKASAFGTGYYISGMVSGQKEAWTDCDRDLKASLTYVKDQTRLGAVYYSLGVCNYRFGKLTHDKSRVQAGLQYSQQSAKIPGAMQNGAYQNTVAMQRELSTWR